MGIWFIRVAVVYVAIGVILGLIMGITQHFEYATVHAHINLLGWATLGLAGLIYVLFPQAGNGRLAVIHFWLHNVGLPIFIIGLFWSVTAGNSAVPVVATGAVITILGILVFMANVLMNVRTVRAV